MKIDCPNCGAKLNVTERLHGKSGKCSKCGVSVTIPLPTEPSEPDIPVLEVDTSFADTVKPSPPEHGGQQQKIPTPQSKPVSSHSPQGRSRQAPKKKSMTHIWLWLVGFIVASAIIATVFYSANSGSKKEQVEQESTKEQPKQESGWFVVAELSGTGKRKGNLFKITGEKCRLTYSVEGDGQVAFAVFVVKEGTTKDDRVVQEVMTPYAGSDTVYFEKEPGNYFLDIRAMTINRWEVKIEEYRSNRAVTTNENKGYGEVSKCIGEMAYIPPGEFIMGCSQEDGECDAIEKPAHLVNITKGFRIDKCEVTQGEYQRVMGNNPSRCIMESNVSRCVSCWSGCPVDSVTWDDANSYCKKVGKRLPTEAEWEYAARGGTTTKYYWGNTMDGDYEWYGGNTDKTHPVGQKKPNGYGVYDMLGNMAEWVNDWYDEGYYASSPTINPEGPLSGKQRILRGGVWLSDAKGVRVSVRFVVPIDTRTATSDGFRCVKDME